MPATSRGDARISADGLDAGPHVLGAGRSAVFGEIGAWRARGHDNARDAGPRGEEWLTADPIGRRFGRASIRGGPVRSFREPGSARGRQATGVSSNLNRNQINFADRCHHAKEEDELFPVLREHHVDPVVIDLLIKQHEEGRILLAGIEDQLKTPTDEGSKIDAQALGRYLFEYAQLMDRHIILENEYQKTGVTELVE